MHEFSIGAPFKDIGGNLAQIIGPIKFGWAVNCRGIRRWCSYEERSMVKVIFTMSEEWYCQDTLMTKQKVYTRLNCMTDVNPTNYNNAIKTLACSTSVSMDE